MNQKHILAYLDSDVGSVLSRRAAEANQSVSDVANQIIRKALASSPAPGNQRKSLESRDGADFDSDRSMVDNILWLLYLARRRDFNGGGLGELQIEQSLGYPFSELEFHLWYLKEKGWVRREDSGLLAITIAGVDKVMDGNTLRNDRLIAEHSVSTEHAGFLLEPASTS